MTGWLVNGALVILLVMRVVGAEVGDGRFGALIAGEDVDEMLIGLLTAVALERDADVPPLVLTALTLLGDEDTDASCVETLELGVGEEAEVASMELGTEETPAAETKMSFCAPAAHPMPLLYPGLTPFGGETLLPVAWFHAIICLAPATQLLESVPQ